MNILDEEIIFKISGQWENILVKRLTTSRDDALGPM